jgi:Domain of unknown function (DUF4116)
MSFLSVLDRSRSAHLNASPSKAASSSAQASTSGSERPIANTLQHMAAQLHAEQTQSGAQEGFPNVFDILDPLSKHAPQAYLALIESMKHNKNLSEWFVNRSSNDPVVQFFLAKKNAELPTAEKLLNALSINRDTKPETLKVLANFINRNAPSLIDKTLKPFQKSTVSTLIQAAGRRLTSAPPAISKTNELIALAQLLCNLLMEAGQRNTKLWLQHFRPETLQKLGALSDCIAHAHTQHASTQERAKTLEALQTSMTHLLARLNKLSLILQKRPLKIEEQDRKDKIVMLARIRSYGEAELTKASQDLREDHSFLMEVMQHNGKALQYTSHADQDNKELVLTAVRQTPWALQYTSPRLNNNSEIVLTAMRKAPGVLDWVNKNSPLFNDKAFLLVALRQYGSALSLASEPLQADRDVVRTAVANHGFALKYANGPLQAYRNIVQTAVANNGLALIYASEPLQADRDVVQTAVANNGLALKYAKESPRADRDVVRTAVANNGLALIYASKPLQADRDIVLTALNKTPEALLYVDDHKCLAEWEYRNFRSAMKLELELERNAYVTRISRPEILKIMNG